MGYITGTITVSMDDEYLKAFSIFNKSISKPIKYYTFIPISNEDHSPEDFVAEEISIICTYIKSGEIRFLMRAPNKSTGDYKLEYFIEWL